MTHSTAQAYRLAAELLDDHDLDAAADILVREARQLDAYAKRHVIVGHKLAEYVRIAKPSDEALGEYAQRLVEGYPETVTTPTETSTTA